MKKLVASFVVVSLLLTGCTGSFNLTKKVYNIHRSQPDKWVDEVLFLVFVIVPVYGLATLADAIVFNTVEFWTGSNPVAANDLKPVNIASGKEGAATLNYDRSHDQVELSIFKANESIRNLTFEKTDTGVVAKDANGQTRFRTVHNEDGSVSLFNGQDQLIQTFDQAKVAETMNRFKG